MLIVYFVVLICLFAILYAGSESMNKAEFLIMLLLAFIWPFCAVVFSLIAIISFLKFAFSATGEKLLGGKKKCKTL